MKLRNVRHVANQQRNVVHVVNVNGTVDGKYHRNAFFLILIFRFPVNVKLNIGLNTSQSAK